VKNRFRKKAILNFLGFIAAISASMTAAFLAVSRLGAQWPQLAQFLTSVWVGLLIFPVFWMFVHGNPKARFRDLRHRQHSALLDALERIAQGDFSVFIEEDEDVHGELAEAINEMAKNLGNLETMRQDFISNVSHEIQSPLTSIGGFAALLKDPDLPEPERRRYAEIIESESRRLSSLSANLLKLSSLDEHPLTKAEFRLDKQLSSVILTLEPQWAAKKLNVEAELEKCPVQADEELLSEVWLNLLHNAIKFTPEGGTIRVSLAEAAVRVEDSGVGIGKEELPHIFERFYKADKARDRALGGNGLGLSLVKKIVELHGGTIAVESEREKGTAFTVRLS
jgi:signal transduction histidine kinase